MNLTNYRSNNSSDSSIYNKNNLNCAMCFRCTIEKTTKVNLILSFLSYTMSIVESLFIICAIW